MLNEYTIVLFYKFCPINDAEALRDQQRQVWEELNLKGRMIIASEGINGTIEGSSNNISKYIDFMKRDPRFADVWFKSSQGTGSAFPKISIKVRDEVCTLGRPDLNPMTKTANFITHDELHEWYLSGKEFYVIDMRNDYEFEVGRFENSLAIEGVRHFRDVPKYLDSLTHLKDKTVIPVCTGGIRCEKGSGLLLELGFKHVYQLKGGIHTYLVNYPDGFFKGKLYVFDGRVIMSFGGTKNTSIGKCKKCGAPTENFVNIEGEGKRMHYLMCHNCVEKYKDSITYISHT